MPACLCRPASRSRRTLATTIFATAKSFPSGLWEDVARRASPRSSSRPARRSASAANPLLVSVRSGAQFSMPGMMDTVLNLGLNDETVDGLAALTGDERFAWDAYRRFLQMFGRIVLGVDGASFEHALRSRRRPRSAPRTTPSSTRRRCASSLHEFKNIVHEETASPFPREPQQQLDLAIRAVFRSWFGQRARDYRRVPPHPRRPRHGRQRRDDGVRQHGRDSGTGVAFTRDPNTGENVLFGEYLTNAQGEDVVAGIRTAPKIAQMQVEMPKVYAAARAHRPQARAALSRRAGSRVHHRARPALHAADALREAHRGGRREDRRGHGRGRVDHEKEAVSRIEPAQVEQLLRDSFDGECAARCRAAHERLECLSGRGGRPRRVRRRRCRRVDCARRDASCSFASRPRPTTFTAWRSRKAS